MKKCGLFFSLFFPALMLWPVLSCSNVEPRILYGSIELVYYETDGEPEERFNFFVIPEDDDGIENLAELYLYHDHDGLRWLIREDDWVRFQHEDQTWIGSRSIAMTEGGVLPRGQYRAVLVNKSGEKTERFISFDVPEEPRFPFPSFSIAEGGYSFESRYPRNHFICYDSQGNFVGTVELKNREGSISSLNLPSGASTAGLWAEDAEYYTSALTDVLPVR
ncbi:MAG: hypothetical protein LBP76_07160 [Treponema sp.]|jgi:hypothetical protein|nr:hypothetical protein [Treponema sp.]